MSDQTIPTTAPAPEATTEASSSSWDDTPEQPSEKTEQKAENSAPEKKADDEKRQAEKRERRLRKLLIDGKEELVDEEEAIRAYAKNRAADKRLKEAAEVRKQLEAFKEQFMKDPLSVLQQQNLPINRRELAEQWLKEAIEEELKDPVQRELDESKAKLKKYQEAEELAKQQAQQREEQAKLTQRREELSRLFSEAMESSVLSKEPAHAAEVLREMAMYMRVARQNNPDEPLPSPEELAAHVENQRLKQYHSVAQALSGDQLIGFLGESIVNKIRKADLERIKKQRGVGDEAEVVQSSTSSWANENKKSSERKFMDPITAREMTRKKLGL